MGGSGDSGDSTTDIHEMIQGLQKAAGEAVTAMEVSQEGAQSSVEEIEEAGIALQTISKAMSTVLEMSHQIASAAEEQSQTTIEQNNHIKSIADIAEQAVHGANESKIASSNLAKLAEAQTAMIAKFKL